MAELFEIAAPEIGEVVSGRKKTQNNCKRSGNKKQFENNWEVEKRNTSVGQEEPILEKVDRKTVALAKKFLTI